MDDVSLRIEFHRAIDAVATPAPWLTDHVRRKLRKRQQLAQPPARRRDWAGLSLTPTAKRLAAALLVLLVAVAAAGISLAIYRYARQPIPVRPPAGASVRECGHGSVYMVDANVGWQGTQRTTDGGNTWHDVSPSTPPGSIKGGSAVCALDANRAWVTFGTGSVPYQPDHLVVMATRDGGQTWQPVGLIAVGVPVSGRNNFSVELNFFDNEHGWLLMEYAATPMVRVLYATSNGGAQWTVVSKSPGLGLGEMTVGCEENGIMFSRLETGWLAWDCSRGYGDHQATSGPVMAFTSDGGRTWAPLSLDSYDPTGRICSASTPIFSGSLGVLQVTCLGNGKSSWAALYSSADGGRTWAVHALPLVVTVDLVDGTMGFYFSAESDGNTLYRTTDSGRNWSVVATGLFPGNTASGLTFLDGTTALVSVSNTPAPWWTHDGGKTWSLPGPYRSVGNIVCTLPSDPGAGSGPAAVKMVSATTGWAAGARRTTDGGATWVSTKPPQAKYATSGYAEFFLDPTHGWVAESVGSPKACSDRFVILSTVDGGSTWRYGAQVPIQVQGLDKSDGSWVIRLYFVDTDYGWLRIEPIYGLAPVGYQGPLYRTVDGGKNWTFVASQAAQSDQGCMGRGEFVFSSATNGWMGASCAKAPDSGLDILVTRDGGSTWALQSLVPNYCNVQYFPGGCSTTLPTFVDSSNGWALDKGTPLLLMTSDGGVTWTRQGLPRLPTYACTGKYGEPETCSDQSIVAVSFIDPNQGWTIIGRDSPQVGMTAVRLEHTMDGGKSWTPVSSNLAGLSAIPDLSRARLTFVEQSNGFLWTGSLLISTTDGGHTWSPVAASYR